MARAVAQLRVGFCANPQKFSTETAFGNWKRSEFSGVVVVGVSFDGRTILGQGCY